MRLTLINPNTNPATTAEMVAIATEVCAELRLTGLTAPFGEPLITEPAALLTAARAVESLVPVLVSTDGVIVAAFGDPGLEALKKHLPVPVTGIAEAAMAEAAVDDRRFAVVTTTPALVSSIAARAADYEHANFGGTWLTPGDPVAIMTDQDALVVALAEACDRAVLEGGAEAIVIGGGPLARAARALAGIVSVPLIEPVPAAVRLAKARHAARSR